MAAEQPGETGGGRIITRDPGLIEVAGQDKTRVEGLYAGRPAIPTGRLILNALSTMKIIPRQRPGPVRHPPAHAPQLRNVDLLGIDPRQLR